jgi:hypothetical protein
MALMDAHYSQNVLKFKTIVIEFCDFQFDYVRTMKETRGLVKVKLSLCLTN